MAEPAPYIIEDRSESLFDSKSVSANEAEGSAAVEIVAAPRKSAPPIGKAAWGGGNRSSLQILNPLTAIPKRSLLTSFTRRRTTVEPQSPPKVSTDDLFLVEDLLPEIADQHVGNSAAAGMGSEALFLWLRRADRKFKVGKLVFRVNKNGKIVKRKLFIGKEPETIEINSATATESTSHLSLISQVLPGRDSEEFRAYDRLIAERKRKSPTKATWCLVISFVNTEDTWSLVFEDEADFRDVQWLLRIERRAIRDRINAIGQDYAMKLSAAGLPS